MVFSYLRFSPEPIFVVDATGNFVFSNIEVRDLFQRVPGELINTNLFEYENADNTAMQGVLDTEEGLRGLEEEVVTDDGRVIPVERYLYPLFDAEGDLMGGLEMNRDVSERISAQEREKQLEQLRSYQATVAEEFRSWLGAASQGDYTIDPELPEQEADFDDIQQVYGEFVRMNNNLQDAINRTNRVLVDVQQGTGDLDDLSDELNTVASETETKAESIDTASTEVASMVSQQIKEGEEAAESAADLSASIEEVTATTQEIASQSSRAQEMADEGMTSARSAVDRMEVAVEASEENIEHVRNLEDQMKNVMEMADMIADIADETNLLALNANIEAARSGADGDGFGVVATEVETLAEETKDTVAEISRTLDALREDIADTTDAIERSNEEITSGAETVEEVVDRLEAIDEAVAETDEGVSQITDATDDQAEGAQTVQNTVEALSEQSRDIDEYMSDISSRVGEQTERAEQVNDVADTIDSLSTELSDELSLFKLAADGESTGER